MSPTKSTLLCLFFLSTLVCVAPHHVEGHRGGYTIPEIWGFGIVASFGMSMLSFILAIVLISMSRSKWISIDKLRLFTMMLIAIAVGALVAVSIVHIAPQIFGTPENEEIQVPVTRFRLLHNGVDHSAEGDADADHDHADNDGGDGGQVTEETLSQPLSEDASSRIPAITSLLALIGIGFSMLVERLFECAGSQNTYGFKEVQIQKNTNGQQLQEKYLPVAGKKPVESERLDGAVVQVEMAGNDKAQLSRQDSGISQEVKSQDQTNLNQRRNIIVGKKAGIVALLSTIIHNIFDGFAIGATFSTGNKDIAIGTFLAVFARQIPQDIGDLNILVQSKFSFCQALILKGLVNLSTCVGAAIGLGIGLANEVANAYLLAYVAGNFIFTSLMGMWPSISNENKGGKSVLFLANLVMGAGIQFAFLTITA